MGGLLEGKEVEKKLGDVGEVSVDVSKDGKVKVELSAIYKKDAILSVESKNSVDLDLFALLQEVAAKNDKTWDDALLAQLKVILGLVG